MTGLSLEEMTSWRDKLKHLIESKAKSRLCEKVHVINPVDYYNTVDADFQNDKEYIRWEFRSVETADVVIVGWNKEQDSLGTMAELVYAYAHHIPVILYLYDMDSMHFEDLYCDFNYDDIHPFVMYIADKYYMKDEIEELADFIVKYYCM